MTHHIHYLEQHYGCQLFSYERKVLRLTEAGLRLREFTRSMSYNSQKIEEAMAAEAPISLRVGISKTIGEYVIAPKVERFLRAHPEANFSLLVDNTQALLRALEEGQIDLCWSRAFLSAAGMRRSCSAERIFLAYVSRDTVWQGAAYLWMNCMGNGLFFMRQVLEPGPSFEDALHRLNDTLDSFESIVTISEFEIIKSLVADGLGIPFLYASVVERELGQGKLARFELTDVPMSGEFYFACLKNNLFFGVWAEWMQ